MAVIGTAYVQIRALTNKLQGDISKSLDSSTKGIGEAIGNRVMRGLSQSLADGKVKLGDDTFDVDSALKTAGEKALARFRGQMNSGRLTFPEFTGFDSVDRASKNARDTINRNLTRSGFKLPEVDTSPLDRAAEQAKKAGRNTGIGFIDNFGEGQITYMMRRIFFIILWGTPAVGALVGALSSLVSGLFSVGAAVAPAANALAILPGLGFAAASGIGTLVAAFGGVGKAFSAGTNAANAAGAGIGGAAKKAVKTVAMAVKSMPSANFQIKFVLPEERALRDAIEGTTEAVANATDRVRQAELGLSAAQTGSRRAQEAINSARAQALDDLIELGFGAEQAAISEGKAAIALARAQERFAEMAELPVNHRLYQEAALNLRQAQLDMKEATKGNQDAAKANSEAAAKGVEGSDAVVEARENERDAAQEVLDAQRELTQAQADLTKTQRDGAEQVADAQKDLAEALRGTNDAVSGGASGINAFNKAMAGLSPAAQEFVRYLLSIRGQFTALRQAAGEELFPKLITSIDRIISSGFLTVLADGLRVTGGAIGDVALKMADFLSSPIFQDQLGKLFTANVPLIQTFGDALVNVMEALSNIAEAAIPFTQAFADWIAQVTSGWAERTGLPEFAGKIEHGVAVVTQLKDIFKLLWDNIVLIADAARPAGETLLDSFQGALEGLSAWLQEPERADKLTGFFAGVAKNVTALGSLLVALADGFARMGDDPAVADMANTIKDDVLPVILEVLTTVTDKVGPHLAETFGQLVAVFGAVANSGGLNAFLDVISAVASAFLNLTKIPGFAAFVTTFAVFVGTYKALNLVANVTGVSKLVTDIGAMSGRLTAYSNAQKVANAATAASGGTVSKLSQSFPALGGAVNAVKNGFSSFGGKIGSVGEGFKKLGGVIKGNPLMTIAIVIGAIVAAFAATEKGQAMFQKLADTIMTALTPAFEALAPLFDQLGPIFQQLGTTLAPIFQVLGDAVGQILTTLGPPLGELMDVLGGAFMDIITALMPLFAAFGDILVQLLPALLPLIAPVVLLVGALLKLIEPVAELIAALLPPLIAIIVALITPILDLVGWLADLLVPAIEALSDAIPGVVDGIESFIEWLTGLAEAAAEVIGNMVAIGSDIINGLIEGLSNGISAVADWISGVGEDIINWFKDVFGISSPSTVMAELGGFLLEGLLNGLEGIVEAVSAVWNAIKDAIAFVWDVIVAVVTLYITTVKTVVTTVFNAVMTVVTTIWNGIVNTIKFVWEGIVAFVTAYINTVRSVITTVLTAISSTMSSIWNGISTTARNVWNGIVNTVMGIVNGFRTTIQNTFQSIVNGIGSIWDGITGKISGALTGLIGIIRGPLNSMINTVNGLIDNINNVRISIPDWVPGLGGKSFSIDIPRIPRLAEGGVVSARPGGILANIGEGRHDEQVTPLRADGLSQGEFEILNALRNLSRGEVNQTFMVPPTIDIPSLARAVAREFEFTG